MIPRASWKTAKESYERMKRIAPILATPAPPGQVEADGEATG
jgi:hypothetical protein